MINLSPQEQSEKYFNVVDAVPCANGAFDVPDARHAGHPVDANQGRDRPRGGGSILRVNQEPQVIQGGPTAKNHNLI
jgi:hypothetical protein